MDPVLLEHVMRSTEYMIFALAHAVKKYEMFTLFFFVFSLAFLFLQLVSPRSVDHNEVYELERNNEVT